MTRLDRLTERLNLKEFQLRALLDLTKAINNNSADTVLLKLYASIMRDELGITRILLYENDGSWRLTHAYGAEGVALPDAALLIDHCKDITFIGGDSGVGVDAFDIAVPVYHRGKPLALLLIGDLDDPEQRMSPTVKHLNFIQTLTNLIVVAQENRRFAVRALAQERDRRELELAAEMQQMLVPRDLPTEGRVQAAAWYQPHQEVGGDYYDVIKTGPEQYVVCVADVSGKGIPAALLMSNFQATLRAMLQRDQIGLDVLVSDLNANVMERARGERFITLFIALADLNKGELTYVNAGHNPPMLLRDGRVEELSTGSIALGMLPDLPFIQQGKADLRDATLLCYTDGFVEQEDSQGNDLGTGVLRKHLELLASSGPRAVNDALIATFEAHRGGLAYLDDIALLTCRFR
ncbi:MAG: PP2C family protein-serine/threonine phosphatase [Flavobacteriales bacterium]